jgi:hypothetical protein
MRNCGLSVQDRDQKLKAPFGVRRLAAAFESGSKLPHSKAVCVAADSAARRRLFLLRSRMNATLY